MFVEMFEHHLCARARSQFCHRRIFFVWTWDIGVVVFVGVIQLAEKSLECFVCVWPMMVIGVCRSGFCKYEYYY